jgi:hypothetical protein
MMTKRDYTALARIIGNHFARLGEVDCEMIDDLAKHFKKDNPLFDRDKFFEAVERRVDAQWRE